MLIESWYGWLSWWMVASILFDCYDEWGKWVNTKEEEEENKTREFVVKRLAWKESSIRHGCCVPMSIFVNVSGFCFSACGSVTTSSAFSEAKKDNMMVVLVWWKKSRRRKKKSRLDASKYFHFFSLTSKTVELKETKMKRTETPKFSLGHRAVAVIEVWSIRSTCTEEMAEFLVDVPNDFLEHPPRRSSSPLCLYPFSIFSI